MKFIGRYEGTGMWYDAAGKSAAYRIHQSNQVTPGGFDVSFRHDFDDGSVVEAKFNMTWIAPNLFRVEVDGATVGNGYVFGDVGHYHMKVGDKFVEVSYQADSHAMQVFGSSSTNAEGDYIAWKETLRPASN